MSGLLEPFVGGGKTVSSLTEYKLAEAATQFAQAGSIDAAVACALLSPWSCGGILEQLGRQSELEDLVVANPRFLTSESSRRLSKVLGVDVWRLCLERNVYSFTRLAYSVRFLTLARVSGLEMDEVLSLVIDMISQGKLAAEIDDVSEVLIFSSVKQSELVSSILEGSYRDLEDLKEKVC